MNASFFHQKTEKFFMKYQKRLDEIKNFLEKNPGISKRRAAQILNIPAASFRKLVRDDPRLEIYFPEQKPIYTQFDRHFQIHSSPYSPGTIHRSLNSLFDQKLSEEKLKALDPALTLSHIDRYRFVGRKGCWCCGKKSHYGSLFFLELDHISGNNLDYRLSNLRLICACCHNSTNTHGSKNRRDVFEAMQKPSNLIGSTNSVEESLYQNFLSNLELAQMKEDFRQNMFSFQNPLQEIEK